MTFRQADDLPKTDTGIVGRLMNILKGKRHGMPQVIGTVSDKENAREMGYVLQLPDFMVNWDKLSPGRRSRRLNRYLKQLERCGIEVVCIPYYYGLLPEEVIEGIGGRFVVDSAYQMRIFALVDSVRHLLGMLKDRIHSMEVGIWGADSWAGSLLARTLAPSINHMALGGMDEEELYRLADEILMETGLSCPVITDAARCLKNKQLVVVADECDLGLLSSHAIVVYAGAINPKHIEAMKSGEKPLSILSGWATLPDGIKADIELLPWETLGVLQALSLMGGEMDEMNRMLDTVKVRGFVLPEGGITYDTFRIRYFRKKGVILFS